MISDSSFRVTLQIHHPSMPAEDIANNFGYPTRYRHSVGMNRKTKSGKRLNGIYKETSISFMLHDEPLKSFESISEFLLNIVDEFDVGAVGKIASSGGQCVLMFGVYSSGNVFFELSSEVINKFSSLGFSIKFDFYGGED